MASGTDIIARGLGAKALKIINTLSDKIELLSSGVSYKGAVDYYNQLPKNPAEGDAYTVKYKGASGTKISGLEYVWGKYEGVLQWVSLGADFYLPECTETADGDYVLRATIKNGQTTYTWVVDNTLTTSEKK